MTDNDWTSRIAGERMAVDKQFNGRVEASSFSNQQWGLVMTAIEFEIANPADPATAELVADTSKLGSIMPEIDRVGNQSPMGGAPNGGASESEGGGFLGGVKSMLGLGGGGEDERAEEAESLAQAYADELQSQLESNGRWKTVCEQAAG